MNFNDVTIVSVKGSDYRIRFWYMSKNDAISIMNNSKWQKGCVVIFFIIYNNEWENVLSKKQRFDTKWSKWLLWKGQRKIKKTSKR